MPLESSSADDKRKGAARHEVSEAAPFLTLIEGGASDTRSLAARRSYERLLNSIAVAVYTTDAEGQITFYNDAAVEFWGRRPELGELWCGSLRLYWPDGTPMDHSECPMAIALREKRPVRGYEAIVERPDGSRLTFEPHPTPIIDDDGEMIGAVNVLVDVTKRRMAEDALRATAHALQVSNAVKDEFLGLVSHELRTPVTTIVGNAHLLRDRSARLSEQDRDAMLGDIAGDAERLRTIVENLLLLTRLDSGPSAESEPQILAHVVGRTVDRFAARHPARRMEFDSDARYVIVESDRTYLEMLMDNLLSNADKYSPPDGEIRVVVSADGDEAQVMVLDHGPGIDESEAMAVFTPFYRSELTSSLAGGVGIGLAVCKRIVESLGGRIWARRREGGGAEVGFALPLATHAS
jgi:PAS domain S-box-containing protein